MTLRWRFLVSHFDVWRYRRPSWQQGSGPGSGILCQGSATGDPCTSRFPTFLAAAIEHIFHVLPSINTLAETMSSHRISPAYSGPCSLQLAGFRVSEHLQTSRNASSRNSNVSVLAQRHTSLTFGRDSAAKSSTLHPDWLLISCPCRPSPIRSHETLRADGRSEGRGGDAPRVARLGGGVSENVMFCGFVLSSHFSCFIYFYP